MQTNSKLFGQEVANEAVDPSDTTLPNHRMMKLAGAKWKALSSEEKAEWKDKAAALKCANEETEKADASASPSSVIEGADDDL